MATLAEAAKGLACGLRLPLIECDRLNTDILDQRVHLAAASVSQSQLHHHGRFNICGSRNARLAMVDDGIDEGPAFWLVP